MNRQLDSWHSPSLNKEMEIVTYGHFGKAVLLLPTAAADYLEYERFLLIDALKSLINSGNIKVFSVNSINSESWLNDYMLPSHKAIRHNDFNHYIYNEVVPYIKSNTSFDTPIIISGASLGALHSANLFFKRPDLIDGVIAMSGMYDLTNYTKGFMNEDVYYNSPQHYLGNLNDKYYLPMLQNNRTIIIATGSGNYESPNASTEFSKLLGMKRINHKLDVWGNDMHHDWPTWRSMLPYFIDTYL